MTQEILDAILKEDCKKIKENYKADILEVTKELKKLLDVEGEKCLLPPIDITPMRVYHTLVYSENSDKEVDVIFSQTVDGDENGKRIFNIWKIK